MNVDRDTACYLKDRAIEDPLFEYAPRAWEMLGNLLIANARRGMRGEETPPPPKNQNERLASAKERFLAKVGNAT